MTEEEATGFVGKENIGTWNELVQSITSCDSQPFYLNTTWLAPVNHHDFGLNHMGWSGVVTVLQIKKILQTLRETGPLQLIIFRHSDVIRGNSHCFRIFEWHRMTGFIRDDRDEIKNGPIFPGHLGWQGMTECAGNDQNRHSNIIPVIPKWCHFASFQYSNDHGMNGMTPEWRYFVIMIDGMTLEWWNDIQMTGMIFK